MFIPKSFWHTQVYAMNTKYYPDIKDPDFYDKIYRKKEFYMHRVQENMYIDKTMEQLCTRDFTLQPYQEFLRNFISPNTPYDRLLVWYGTGVGKCVLPNTVIYYNGKTMKIQDLWHEKFTDERNTTERAGDNGMFLHLYDYDSTGMSPLNKTLSINEPSTVALTDISSPFLPHTRPIIYHLSTIKSIYRQYIMEFVNEIITESGLKISCTNMHRFFDISFTWLFAQDIVPGVTRVCVRKDNVLTFELVMKKTTLYYAGYVYDMEVPQHHNYLANNFVAHNTCSAISIAENFKSNIRTLWQNGQEAYIYVIGSTEVQQAFINELTGPCGTSVNNTDENPYLREEHRKKLQELASYSSPDAQEKYKKARKEYILARLTKPENDGFYQFLSYAKFANLIHANKLPNINNSLLIVDEAHNLLNNNSYQQAIEKILAKSHGTRAILLTANAMFNTPVQIIEIINILLPLSAQLKKSDFFRNETDLKEGALQKLQEVTRGLIVYVRGNNPYTFPERIDHGVVPKGIRSKEGGYTIKHTKLIRCPMSKFHFNTYRRYIKSLGHIEMRHLLDFILPDPDNPSLGVFLEEDLILKKIPKASAHFLKKYSIELIADPTLKTIKNAFQISGACLTGQDLKKYSNKYFIALSIINSATLHRNGIHYVFNTFVNGSGIKLFGQILHQNGYKEYSPFSPQRTDATTDQNIRCYFCGVILKKHHTQQKSHEYFPSYYALIHGDIPKEDRFKILDTYNSDANKDASRIKVLLASMIGRESLDLKRVSYIHILNFQENFSRVEQIIGRGIRHCSHVSLPPNKRVVNVYRYVSSLPSSASDFSAEEIEYAKDEKNFVAIKNIERALKRSAIDCAFNKPLNVFKPEVSEYKDCTPPNCPQFCDFQRCDYSCTYKPPGDLSGALSPSQIDTTTYLLLFYDEEVTRSINYIKHLFATDVSYSVQSILKHFKDTPRVSLIDKTYILLALDYMVRYKVPIRGPSPRVAEGATPRVAEGALNKGHLIVKEDYFFFQPDNAQSTELSLNERRSSSHEPTTNEIPINYYVENILTSRAPYDKKIVISSIKEEMAPHVISKILSDLTLEQQQELLEDMLRIYQTMRTIKNTDYVFKILRHYKDFLITKEQYNDDSDYTITTDNDILRPSSPDEDTITTTTTLTPHTAKKKKFIGHILSQVPRCMVSSTSTKFSQCRSISVPYLKHRKEKENDIIIGYIERNQHNKMVFKLRYPEKGAVYDKRKEKRGFVCAQMNNKEELLTIAKRLGITSATSGKSGKSAMDDADAERKIVDICTLIQLNLRERQYRSRKKKEGIRYFYEYLDILRRDR